MAGLTDRVTSFDCCVEVTAVKRRVVNPASLPPCSMNSGSSSRARLP